MSNWIIFYITLLNWEFLLKWCNFFWNFCWIRGFLLCTTIPIDFNSQIFILFMLRSRKFWKVAVGYFTSDPATLPTTKVFGAFKMLLKILHPLNPHQHAWLGFLRSPLCSVLLSKIALTQRDALFAYLLHIFQNFVAFFLHRFWSADRHKRTYDSRDGSSPRTLPSNRNATWI